MILLMVNIELGYGLVQSGDEQSLTHSLLVHLATVSNVV